MMEHIIRHCAPTLAGMKPAGLFSFSFDNELVFVNQLLSANRLLSPKGLCAELLRTRGGSALILVYRQSMLLEILRDAAVSSFLAEQGYSGDCLRACLIRLKHRLSQHDFPHEIGLFLGYPLHDVLGFIHHKGQNCKLTGNWKVYADECAAQKLFARFSKCSEVYIRLFLQGKPIERLIVAA